MTTQINTLPTLHAVHLRSDWAGEGAVDDIVAVATSHEEADRLDAEGNWPTEGQYGRLFTRVETHAPSQAMQNLVSKGATIDGEDQRIWIGDDCVACSQREVAAYAALSKNTTLRPG